MGILHEASFSSLGGFKSEGLESSSVSILVNKKQNCQRRLPIHPCLKVEDRSVPQDVEGFYSKIRVASSFGPKQRPAATDPRHRHQPARARAASAPALRHGEFASVNHSVVPCLAQCDSGQGTPEYPGQGRDCLYGIESGRVTSRADNHRQSSLKSSRVKPRVDLSARKN